MILNFEITFLIFNVFKNQVDNYVENRWFAHLKLVVLMWLSRSCNYIKDAYWIFFSTLERWELLFLQNWKFLFDPSLLGVFSNQYFPSFNMLDYNV